MNQKKRNNSSMEQFHSFLQSLYNTVHTPQEREMQLVEWVNSFLKQQENQETKQPWVGDWKQMLQLAWQAVMDKTEDLTRNDWIATNIQTFSKELSRPAHLMYIQLTNKPDAQESLISQNDNQHVNSQDLPDWMELISEIANTESERCFIVPVSTKCAGVYVMSDPDSDVSQSLDLIIEECKAWLDVLLGELYLDATIGIGSFVQNSDQVLDAMTHAFEACTIGARLYGPHGVYSFERLALQRMLYDVATSNLVDREQLLSQSSYELLGHELRDTALSFFRNHLNISETARVLYLHRNSLLYRLDKIRDITGYDIRKFEDAVALWTGLSLWRFGSM